MPITDQELAEAQATTERLWNEYQSASEAERIAWQNYLTASKHESALLRESTMSLRYQPRKRT